MVSSFTPGIGMVGGFTMLSDYHKSKDGIFSRVQNLDWVYLLSVGAGAAGLGRPVSILGNNFGFRRAVYDAVGGYRRLGFTIIEDFALMNAMLRQTSWRVRFLLAPDAAIFSLPPLSWRAFIDQRKRWSAGGKEVSAFGKLLLIAGLLRHFATVMAIIFLKPLLPILLGIGLALAADFLLLHHTTRRLQRRDALRYFPLFEIYFLLYSFFFAPVVALPTTVRWKNVVYHWRFGRRVHKIEESHS
jgi:cellulose synthase/poly-beta-1,6-N-acetylglucosamine synthase-like glycosyltransferase